MADSNVTRTSRREFLRLLTGNALDTASRAVAASIPNSETLPTSAQRARAENLACAKTLVVSENHSTARCARCYAEFVVEGYEITCAACRKRDEQNQSLFSTLELNHDGEK